MHVMSRCVVCVCVCVHVCVWVYVYMCVCVRDCAVLVGRTTIALNHLPTERSIDKWYQLSFKENTTVAVLLLRLHYSLAYSLAKQTQDQGMTAFPAHGSKIENPFECKSIEMRWILMRSLDNRIHIDTPCISYVRACASLLSLIHPHRNDEITTKYNTCMCVCGCMHS